MCLRWIPLGLLVGACASLPQFERGPASLESSKSCTEIALEFLSPASSEPLAQMFARGLEGKSSKFSERSLLRLAGWLDGAPLQKGESFDLIEDAVAALESFDEVHRALLSQNLLRRYSRYTKDPSETMSQKRVVDIMLNLLQDPASSIEKEIAQGKSPVEAFKKVFNPRLSTIKGQAGFGEYRVEQVIEFAGKIQRYLKQQHPDLKLTLGGSLPNMLANTKHSDLDILGDVTHLSESELKLLKNQIRSFAKQIFGTKSSFNVEEITPENYGNYFRIANSVFIEIGDSKLTLITNPAGLRYIEGPPYLENPNASSRFLFK